MADSTERTEQPTPKRLEEARQKGNVAKSVEVNAAVSLLLGLTLLYFMSGMFLKQFLLIMRTIFSGGYLTPLSPDNLRHYVLLGLERFGPALLIFLAGIMLVGLGISVLQVGFLFTWEPLQPKLEKINPAKGFKKILFSRRSLEELVKNLLKLAVVLLIGYLSFRSLEDQLIPLMDQGVAQIGQFMARAAMSISLKIAGVFLLIAAADYAFQKYEHLQNLKMTRQEVKDEAKQQEGDPQIRSKIRARQMQMVRQRMMQQVPEADVVITNPTHYAVALKYEPQQMEAPRVVAKGKNFIALKIREIAEAHQVPIVEDPPLARALYQAVEVDQTIPAKFFQAVAEVLAYVYKLKNKRL
ncbi:MAG: flagellar biosynthesis protein FlhB [Calditrichaeota bacterium]|nr:MAG: flagellar biosynthesis protein FlhB [Calditrichota bacterium]